MACQRSSRLAATPSSASAGERRRPGRGSAGLEGRARRREHERVRADLGVGGAGQAADAGARVTDRGGARRRRDGDRGALGGVLPDREREAAAAVDGALGEDRIGLAMLIS